MGKRNNIIQLKDSIKTDEKTQNLIALFEILLEWDTADKKNEAEPEE